MKREYADGNIYWSLNERLHREGAPAVERANGTKEWWVNGKRHRQDGPAIEYADGTKYWYINGRVHREDGAAIEYADGTKYWYINGMEYDDVATWARVALQHQRIEPTQDAIAAKVAQVMQQDLFS